MYSIICKPYMGHVATAVQMMKREHHLQPARPYQAHVLVALARALVSHDGICHKRFLCSEHIAKICDMGLA